MKNNRREFLRLAGLAGIGLTGVMPGYGGQPPAAGSPIPAEVAMPPLNRFPRMVQEYFVGRMRKAQQAAAKRHAGLRTKAQAQAYVKEVQAKIRQCLGPWPQKTPLNARVTGTLARGAYNIEKVIFESRPGFPVTANLYVPQQRKGPLPAVVGTCGHSDVGKAAPIYQSFAQGLARQGYVVLIFDPIGQGERIQYLSAALKPRHGIGVAEHNYVGNQMVLTGEAFSSWLAWDGIRCVDYLLTRPEVDPRHIGVTGNSGGGTQATWLCGVEPRLTMAAPSCFVVGFGTNLENELPADIEQCPPAALRLGLDHTDFIAAMAPKPVMLLGQEKDFFDVRGLEESFARLQHLYRLLGAPDNVQLFIGPEYHGYSQHNREAMYGWFNQITQAAGTQAEPTLMLEPEETLWCMPHGQVGETGPRTVFSFTSQLAAALNNDRPAPQGEDLKKAVAATLKLPARRGAPHYRILRPLPAGRFPRQHATAYAVETEAGILTVVYRLQHQVLLSRPPKEVGRALLYVSHHSADDELRQEPWLAGLIGTETHAAVYACDVRGTGESRPNTCGNDFLAPYGNDYFYAAHSLLFDYPYLGQKTHDLLRVLDWLKACGHEQVHLVAKGWGALPATFAALLSGTVAQVTLKNALTSYADIAQKEEYNWPLSTLLPGVLKRFDLPDCYRALAAKHLRQIEPWDAGGGKAG